MNLLVKDVDLINRKIWIKPEDDKKTRGFWKPIPKCMDEYFNTLPKECLNVFYRKTIKSQKGGNKSKPKVEYKGLGDFKKAMDKLYKDAGFVQNTFRDTRHYANTMLEEQGFSIVEIMSLNGWVTDDQMNIYRNKGISNRRQGIEVTGAVSQFSNSHDNVEKESGDFSGDFSKVENNMGSKVG